MLRMHEVPRARVDPADEGHAPDAGAPMSPARERPTSGRQRAREQSVARAVAYIDARFREPVTLSDIASAAHVSKFHFARMFRAQIGMSPMQYVRARRVMEAKRLLRSGQNPVVKIATELGYFDHSHFSRAFRSATGMCPHQYLAAAARIP
jgi:AraC family transcriptional regulator